MKPSKQTNRSKYLLIGAGAAVGAGAVLTSRAITKYLMRVALDREEPKTMARARTKSYQTPEAQTLLRALDAATAGLEERYAFEDAEIVGRDGVRLVAHWLPCRAPRRVVVAMHGWRSSWKKDFGMIVPFLHDSGCSVLYVEQRGQNNSGGECMTFGVKERYDCLDWIRWVEERTDETLPIYLIGISMGASTVLMTSGLPLPERVHGIVADCGFTSPYAIWRHVVEDNLHLSYRVRGNAVDRICREKFHGTARAYSTLDALAVNTTPVLFVHGADDHFVPIEMTYENYRACRAPRRLLVVPGASHGLSYYVERERYEDAVRRFWAEFD